MVLCTSGETIQISTMLPRNEVGAGGMSLDEDEDGASAMTGSRMRRIRIKPYA